MKLTADQFQDVVALLNATGGAKNEKRRAARFGVRLPAAIIPCDGDNERRLHTVVVVDISATGVGLVSALSLDRGQRFILHIAHRAGSDVAALQCTVAYSRKQENGSFRMGAKFERMLAGTGKQPADPEAESSEQVDHEHVMQVEERLRAASSEDH